MLQPNSIMRGKGGQCNDTNRKDTFPAGTGLLEDGFANPRILVKIDVEAIVQDGDPSA